MKKPTIILTGATTIIFIVSLMACTTKLDLDTAKKIDLATSQTLPIGSLHANIFDIVKAYGDSINMNPQDSSLYILWNDSNFNLNFQIEDFSQGAQFSKVFLPATDDGTIAALLGGNTSVTIPDGQFVTFTQNIRYNIGFNQINSDKNIQVDSAQLDSATLNVTLNMQNVQVSDYQPIDVTFHFMDSLGNPFYTFTRTVKSAHENITEHINNLNVKFINKGDSCILPIKITYTTLSYGTFTINDNMVINLTMAINDIHAQNIWGYFYDKNYFSKDVIKTKTATEFLQQFFKEDNKLLFSNPQISFTINSNIGIPLIFTLDSIYSEDKDGNKVYADFNGSTSYNLNIAKPDAPGNYVHSTFNFNRDNGASNKLFTIVPSYINYQWKVANNPDPDQNANGHFVHLPIDINAQISAKLPFQFDQTSHIAFKDTVKADLSEFKAQTDSLEGINLNYNELKIFIDIANKLPLSTTADFTFIDQNGDSVYSYNQLSIKSANIDNEGKTTSANKQTISLGFKNNDIDNILKTKQIVISIKVAGKDDQSKIYIRTGDYLDINFSGYVQGEFISNIDSINRQ